MKAADIFIAVLFIILILISSLFLSGAGDEVLINANSKEYRYPLSEDRIVEVEGLIGTTTIEIKDGKASIIESPCPGKTCLSMKMGNAICCLPNRVLLTIENSSKEVDAYAY